MRLQKLAIHDYKVLQNLTIEFDEQSTVSVLIGQNGSGKTTVVECLMRIFAELFHHGTVGEFYGKANFPFSFRLRYLLRKETNVFVEIGFENNAPKLIVYDEGEKIDTPEILETYLRGKGETVRPLRYLFPENVVVYYSGISGILLKIFTDYQQDMLESSRKGETQANQDLFYFQPQNFPAILVGLLCYQYGNVPEHLREQFGITGFERITIEASKPSWDRGRPSTDFWGAEGDLRNFLDVLRDKTTPEFSNDSIRFTVESYDQLEGLWSYFGTEKRLFEYLAALQTNGLITRIDIEVQKNGLLVPHQRLSEGEKQLLIIQGLRELLAAENSLFLLDEPDTYLHPEWKQRFIHDYLTDENENLAFSLITTHSPGIVSGARKPQLHIFRKQDGRSVLKTFAFNPYGKPEDQILIEFFGLSGLRYPPVEAELEQLQALINRGEFDSEEFQRRLNSLEKNLGRGDEGVIRLKLEAALQRKKRSDAENK